MDQFAAIQKLINEICADHDACSRDFIGLENVEMINLKKKSISSVFSKDEGLHTPEPTFLTLIQQYLNVLNQRILHMEYDYDYRHWDLRNRVKHRDSIINKLFDYRYVRQELGGVPLNKCMNDLLGFRIKIDGFDHTSEEVNEFLEELRQSEYKIVCNNSSKGEYSGTHIYLCGNNNFFLGNCKFGTQMTSKRIQIHTKITKANANT